MGKDNKAGYLGNKFRALVAVISSSFSFPITFFSSSSSTTKDSSALNHAIATFNPAGRHSNLNGVPTIGGTNAKGKDKGSSDAKPITKGIHYSTRGEEIMATPPFTQSFKFEDHMARDRKGGGESEGEGEVEGEEEVRDLYSWSRRGICS